MVGDIFFKGKPTQIEVGDLFVWDRRKKIIEIHRPHKDGTHMVIEMDTSEGRKTAMNADFGFEGGNVSLFVRTTLLELAVLKASKKKLSLRPDVKDGVYTWTVEAQ